MKEYVLNVLNSSEFQGKVADKAIVTISDQLRFRILQMAAMVRALCLFNAADLDDSPRLMVEDWDSERLADGTQPLQPFSGRKPDMMLIVTAHCFYWDGSYQSDVRWSTDSIPLSDLDGFSNAHPGNATASGSSKSIPAVAVSMV